MFQEKERGQGVADFVKMSSTSRLIYSVESERSRSDLAGTSITYVSLFAASIHD